MGTVIFLLLRVLHVLLAALWIGGTVFISFLLMPALEMTGPSSGAVMINLQRRGLNAYMASLGGLTVLTGIYLFWRFTGGFDPEISGSPAGIVYSVGGACGLLATILGGAVVGRSAKQAVEILIKANTLPDGAEKGALLRTIEPLRARMTTFGTIVVMLQAMALALMAIGHYV